MWRLPLALMLMSMALLSDGGFGGPVDHQKTLELIYGKPCDCGGGTSKVQNYTRQLISTADCDDKTAYLTIPSHTGALGPSYHKWACVLKPKIVPTVNDRPGPCLYNVFYQTMHSICYTVVHQCTGQSDNETYWVATRNGISHSGIFGSALEGTQRGIMPCFGTPDKHVYWNLEVPIGYSDGGGVQVTRDPD